MSLVQVTISLEPTVTFPPVKSLPPAGGGGTGGEGLTSLPPPQPDSPSANATANAMTHGRLLGPPISRSGRPPPCKFFMHVSPCPHILNPFRSSHNASSR